MSVGVQATLRDNGPREEKLSDDLISTLVERLREMKAECNAVKLEAIEDAIATALDRWDCYHDPHLFGVQCTGIDTALISELQRKIFFMLPRESRALYETPCEKWEPILSVFPNARNDIEEMGRCMAFNRYPAAVFHALLAVEFGLIHLGKFLGSKGKKPGWDDTSRALEKVLALGRPKATPRIRKHFGFLELVNKDMQSMKLAWRNKVSHAANHLFLMTSDFKPEVADKIITACHGFMLLLATEGPLKK
jgi:hypothetical protein